MPHGRKIVVNISKHSAQVNLGVNSFKGGAMNGDDNIMRLAPAELEFSEAVGLLVPKAQGRVRVSGVESITSKVHLAS